MSGRTLVLIRHARPQIQPGIPASRWELSNQGRRRCRVLAGKLEPYLPAAIVSSTEPKAYQTAEIVGRTLGIPYTPAPGLQEHAREKIPYYSDREDFRKAVVGLIENPDELVFGEETAAQALRRFEGAVRKAVRQQPDINLFIASHGTVMALFVARHNPISPVEFWTRLKMPDMVPLQFPDFRLLPAGGLA